MKALVLNIPALHLGYLACYGNEWIETPHFDQLAAESVVFDQHFADCPGVSGEQRTSWTGRYQFPPAPEHVHPNSEDLPTLDGLLAAAKIACVRIERPGKRKADDDGEATALEQMLHRCRDALDQVAGQEHWLVWVDWPALTPPWDVPEQYLHPYFPEEQDEDGEAPRPWLDPDWGPISVNDDIDLERLQNTYAAAVSHVDAHLGLLREELKERGLTEELLLCITAQCGLALGEHGVMGDCRPWLHEEVIHVPLIVRLPAGAQAGRRVSALTQPVDLLPTFLEAFGQPVPAAVHGHNLWPLLRGQAEQVRAYACAGRRMEAATEYALHTPEWGFLLPEGTTVELPPRGLQLYVKPDDRWEVNNVLQHHLDLAEHLEKVLRGFVEASRRPGPLQPPELRDTEGESARTHGGPAADPAHSVDKP
jgi:arylsulfatase A-like enzyme